MAPQEVADLERRAASMIRRGKEEGASMAADAEKAAKAFEASTREPEPEVAVAEVGSGEGQEPKGKVGWIEAMSAAVAAGVEKAEPVVRELAHPANEQVGNCPRGMVPWPESSPDHPWPYAKPMPTPAKRFEINIRTSGGRAARPSVFATDRICDTLSKLAESGKLDPIVPGCKVIYAGKEIKCETWSGIRCFSKESQCHLFYPHKITDWGDGGGAAGSEGSGDGGGGLSWPLKRKAEVVVPGRTANGKRPMVERKPLASLVVNAPVTQQVALTAVVAVATDEAAAAEAVVAAAEAAAAEAVVAAAEAAAAEAVVVADENAAARAP